MSNTNVIVPKPWTLYYRIIYLLRQIPGFVRNGLFAFIVIGLLSILVFRPLLKSNQPAWAGIHGNLLTVKNSNDEVLWDHQFDFELTPMTTSDQLMEELHRKRSLRIYDIDEDQKKEILLGTKIIESAEHSGKVICLDYKGELKWSYKSGQLMDFGGETYANHYRIQGMFVEKLFSDSLPNIILETGHSPYFPSSVTVLNHKGNHLGSYWHSGRLPTISFADINNDGIKEIFAGGLNNETNGAVLVILDSRKIRGASPQDPDGHYYTEDAGAGEELAYIRFPHTPLSYGRVSDNVTHIRIYPKHFEVTVSNVALHDRRLPVFGCQIVNYSFDFNLNLIDLAPTDPFLDYYLKKEGVNVPAQILDDLKKIEYWDGKSWVMK